MHKTFEERKQSIIDNYHLDFADNKVNWLKRNQVSIKSTLDLVPDIDEHIQTSESFFIKNNYYNQLLTITFLFIFCIIGLIAILENASLFIFIICLIIFIALIIYLVVKLKDKSYKVILTKDIFWFDKMETQIPWKFLIYSYVKQEDYGDDAIYYIGLHYYNEKSDIFEKFEYRYYDLEFEIEDICFHIEKFKQLANRNNNSIK